MQTLPTHSRNLSVVMALNGEPGWICLMSCNVDSVYPPSSYHVPNLLTILPVLFSVLVLHWITSKDNASTFPTPNPNFLPRESSDPPSPARVVPQSTISDLEAYHYGLRDLSRKPGVTTMVTVKDRDELDMERIRSMPMNVVTVTVETDIQHRDLGESDFSSAGNDGSACTEDVGLQRMDTLESREGWSEREDY